MDRDQVTGALFGTPGEALWAKQLGSVESDFGKGLAMDSDGNLIAVGGFRQTMMAGPALTSDGSLDIYVVKLASSTGSVIWSKRLGGGLADSVSGISVDSSNNIYIFGFFAGAVDFGDGRLTASTEDLAAFVLKLDQHGSFGWVRKIDGRGFTPSGAFPGSEGFEVGAVAADGDNVVVAGEFAWLTIDATTLMSAGEHDIFVLSMSARTGTTKWVKRFGQSLFEEPRGVALDSSGNVVLTGGFTGTVNFGGAPLTAPGPSYDGFLLKLTGAHGDHLLSRQFKSPSARGSAITIDPENNILITGDFRTTADLGCNSQLTASGVEALLVKYSPAGSCIWAKGLGGVQASPLRSASAIAVNDAGEIALTGTFIGSLSLGGEPLLSTSGSSDVFAARFDGDGSHLASARSGGPEHDSGIGIAQSPDGRFFVTGSFRGFAEFGAHVFTAVGEDDAFIVGFAPL